MDRDSAKRSPGEGEAERRKLPDRTQWVYWNPTRERLAIPGSEFCVVVREGGTKRKQPVLRPCDRAPKSHAVVEALCVPELGGSTEVPGRLGTEARPESENTA